MKIQLLSIAIIVFFASCTKDRLTADGNIITEVRTTGTFKELRSSGSNHIHVTYGPQFKVEVRGSANLVSRYKTKVYNNTLDLGYEFVNVRRDDIEVYITMPKISGVSLSGSGNVDLYGNFEDTDFFNLRISGSATTRAHNTFNASHLVVNISGSGDADLEKLTCRNAEVHISGSGDTRLACTERLDVHISGSGKVYYSGNPFVESSINGSGKVIKN
ncbi:MAG: DUF2807 domain-containing protein [Sphingobacteriaceae bacterium]|nr:DUF2807 domain-containing protein [Sphingobacteriaceae bacterium]